MLAGFLPFEDDNIIALYKKVILFKRYKKKVKKILYAILREVSYMFLFLYSLWNPRSQRHNLPVPLGFLLELRS
jgi:hypothetical protein